MNYLFGKKKPVATSTTSSSATVVRPADSNVEIIRLRETIQMQEKREEHLQRKIDDLIAEAKERMAKGDKKHALFALKRKKLHEEEITKIQNTVMTLETQVASLEQVKNNIIVAEAMKVGKNALQKHHAALGVDAIGDLMDEIQEQIEMSNEISQALSQPVDPVLADDEELLAELEEMSAQDLEKQLNAPALTEKEVIVMPDVPVEKLPSLRKEDDETEVLRKIQAELASL